MRRKDREVTDAAETARILSDCKIMRLGLNDDGKVYVVPVNFGYTCADGKFIFFFHGSARGRKAELLARNGYAGFETDTGYRLKEAETACGCTALFESVIGGGRVTAITDAGEKTAALNVIMEHVTGKKNWTYTEVQLEAVAVYRLDADELTCKVNKQI